MDNISKVKNCYGCMGCSFSCPKGAISFKINKLGYYSPVIDKDKCVNCGICLSKCPSTNNTNLQSVKREIVGWSKNDTIRSSSSSGGAFFEIASNFIKNGGVVYGAYQSSTFEVEHIRVTTVDELSKLQGSKYIQSNTQKAFSLIKEDLLSNKKVLFSGTPCQVAAIKMLFPNNENLFTIDLVCYGFICNGGYIKYLKGIEKKYKSKVINVIFRDCNHKNMMNISLENGMHIYCPYRGDPRGGIYTQLHNRGAIKEVCSKCKFATSDRIGDITLSDYPYLKSNTIDPEQKGVSVIYLNNDRALKLITKLDLHSPLDEKDTINNFKREYNPSISKNTKRYRRAYLRYSDVKFVKFCDEYSPKTNSLRRLFRKIKNFLK